LESVDLAAGVAAATAAVTAAAAVLAVGWLPVQRGSSAQHSKAQHSRAQCTHSENTASVTKARTQCVTDIWQRHTHCTAPETPQLSILWPCCQCYAVTDQED
jgi:hypothetical protein